MSKSKYNGVDPLQVLERYGADTARMFVLFKAPPEKDLEWDDSDVEGQFRFLNRVWRLVADFVASVPVASPSQASPKSKAEKNLRRATHVAIAETTEDMQGDYQFNTAISEMMKLANAIANADCKKATVYREAIETLVLLLAPFAPHVAEELWQALGGKGSVHQQAFPKADPDALVADEIPLVIQVMGKTRGTIQVPAAADAATLERLARESEIAAKIHQ